VLASLGSAPALAEAVALLLLAGTLAFAVVRPRGLPEAVAAVPAAALAVALGILPAGRALRELRDLGPTIGFLAAVLVLAELCEREGLFEAAGHWMAGASMGRPVRLLSLVFAVGAAVTVVLSLDATVVLLTPVVFQTAARLRLRPKPQVYACTHLANSASLLLPVSNLTNLLAFRASGLSFVRFGALMWLPWLAAITVEWLALRSFFASDLVGRGTVSPEPRAGGAPRYAVAVLAVTLAGFGVASLLGVEEALVAALGALVLAVPAVAGGRAGIADLLRAAALPFLAFVAALGVVVAAVSAAGLGNAVERLVPAGASLPALLAVAATAALLANLVNNLPAILLLLPAVSAAGPGPVLAALVGVNVGPNLTYVGSLATLLWRRALRARDAEPPVGEFLRLGALTVPAALLCATLALWVALRWLGP
jgi:arsenical pump membrane protein